MEVTFYGTRCFYITCEVKPRLFRVQLENEGANDIRGRPSNRWCRLIVMT